MFVDFFFFLMGSFVLVFNQCWINLYSHWQKVYDGNLLTFLHEEKINIKSFVIWYRQGPLSLQSVLLNSKQKYSKVLYDWSFTMVKFEVLNCRLQKSLDPDSDTGLRFLKMRCIANFVAISRLEFLSTLNITINFMGIIGQIDMNIRDNDFMQIDTHANKLLW